MDTGLKTSRGGKISVHAGKIVTTNLWNDKWYEITDISVSLKIRQLMQQRPSALDWIDLRNKYPNVNMIGRPYTRTVTSAAFTPQQSTGTSSQTIVIDDVPKEEPAASEPKPEPEPISDEQQIRFARIEAVTRLQNFFSEFKFKPAARFTNMVASCGNISAAKEFVSGYLRLVNHPEANDILEKIKSPEFTDLVQALQAYPPDHRINDRLKIYFGDAGTGKTTEAVTEYPEAPIIPCNAAILPDELLRTFDFNDENGNPVFKPSVTRQCMEEGKPIIYDEINLLSFDCLRLLQTITDRKDEINFNGETIKIAPGFKVIGTMNLTVNDQVYSLPEPLVDRAEQIREFTITAEELTDYAFA